MPNRILREGILTSERVNLLDWPAEVFYRRLHSAVDDFGRYYAKPELLRAALYPLQLDKVGNPDVAKWLAATRSAALVRTYTVDGKAYLELRDFRQHVRAEKSKFPDPPENCDADAVQVQCSGSASAHVVGDVVEVERKALSGLPPDGDSPERQRNGHDYAATARTILTFLNEKTGRHYEDVKANTGPIIARLKEGSTEQQVRQVIAMKCREWMTDEKMSKFLRPATLFNATKFAQYKGELAHGND